MEGMANRLYSRILLGVALSPILLLSSSCSSAQAESIVGDRSDTQADRQLDIVSRRVANATAGAQKRQESYQQAVDRLRSDAGRLQKGVEHLQKTIDNLKPRQLYEQYIDVDSVADLPTDTTDHLYLRSYLLEQRHKRLVQQHHDAIDYRSQLQQLRDTTALLSAQYRAIFALHGQDLYYRRLIVELQEQARESGYEDWSVRQELLLYTLGFKWFWGMFTGYEPSLYATDESNRLLLAVEEYGKFRQMFTQEMAQHISQFNAAAAEYKSLMKGLSNNSRYMHNAAPLLELSGILDNFINAIPEQADYENGIWMLKRRQDQLQKIVGRISDTPWESALISTPSTPLDTTDDVIGALLVDTNAEIARIESQVRDVQGEQNRTRELLRLSGNTDAEVANHTVRIGEMAERTKSSKLVALESYLAKKMGQLSHSLTLRDHFEKIILLATNTAQIYKHALLFQENLAIYERILSIQHNILTEATARNWSVFREGLLYIFGFKWLWGIFTGFAPTVDTDAEEEDYQQAEERLHVLDSQLTPKLAETQKLFDDAYAQTLSAINSAIEITQNLDYRLVLNRFLENLKSTLTRYQGTLKRLSNIRNAFNRRENLESKFMDADGDMTLIEAYDSTTRELTELRGQFNDLFSLEGGLSEIYEIVHALSEEIGYLGILAQNYKMPSTQNVASSIPESQSESTDEEETGVAG